MTNSLSSERGAGNAAYTLGDKVNADLGAYRALAGDGAVATLGNGVLLPVAAVLLVHGGCQSRRELGQDGKPVWQK